MTTKQIRVLIEPYHTLVTSMNYSPCQMNLDLGEWNHAAAMRHAHWMCHQVLDKIDLLDQLADINGLMFPEELSEHEKVQRWIGWIQGLMACGGHFTVNEEREHVRKAKAS